MTTLVVCLHRGTPLVDRSPPIVGREAVESLVMSVGVADPEDSRVNSILEALRVSEDVEGSVVAVVSGQGDAVGADRSIARQVDGLVDEHDVESAIVVVDSAEDERLVPIVESRVRVDAVDRVVVRQARDIESTYYLLKQFLADEQLRKTVLVPIGAILLAFPALLVLAESITLAIGSIAAAIGLFLLYKGLGVDGYVAAFPTQVKQALYSGQISLVTYVVAGGLALVGLFVGALAISSLDAGAVGEFALVMQFAYDSVPWLTVAALTASAGRLLDEFIREDEIETAYVNLPFVAVAVGLAVRGFSAYFLQRSDVIDPLGVPPMDLGPVSVEGTHLAPSTHLAIFVLASILIPLIGVRTAAYVGSNEVDVGLEERSS